MALVPKFTNADIQTYLQQQKGKIEQAIINRLEFVGEKFIVRARSNDTYKDRTGNLRSSIGYVVVKNGENLAESFPGDKPAGVEQGKTVAENAASNFLTGIVLICVAGMGYAAAVESKGRDVITSSSLVAEQDLKAGLNELK